MSTILGEVFSFGSARKALTYLYRSPGFHCSTVLWFFGFLYESLFMEVISLERLGIYDLHSWFHLDVILYPILVLYYFYYFFVAYVAKYGQVSLRMKKSAKIVMKINDENSNHHLWNNRGIWWCHVTVHKPDATSERMRFSLKTKEVEKARERRDRIFAKIAEFYEIAA